MKLKELFYLIKYRLKNGNNQAVAIGVINCNGKEKSRYIEKLDYVARNTSPCYRTNDEVLAFVKSKYELKVKKLTDNEIETYKTNFLLGKHPEFIERQIQGKPKFDEAGKYPIQKLGLDIEGFTFDYVLEDGFSVVFEITTEKKYDNISVGFRVINRNLSEEEMNILCSVSNEIYIFKGVTKEDILNRTTNFMIYADAVLKRESR